MLKVLDGWWRPVAPLAASLAAAAVAGLVFVDGGGGPAATSQSTLEEALLPTPVVAWLMDDYEMEPLELVMALNEVER
jgi:hypothetical protein